MADRIKSFQQETNQINILKSIRTDLGATASSYTPDTSVVTKDRVVTYAQAEEELSVLGDIEEGVKQQVTDLDIAQKDIKNIKLLLQGNLYDYQTDTGSAYTKTVPNGAMPYAGLEKVGGKTVVWNQLVNSGTTSVATISGHKYYTVIDGTASIVTADGTAITVVDDTADMVCDLTLMFGAGNEPSTVEKFQQMFPASYYPYNAGTLLSAGVTEAESVGKNLFDLQNMTTLFGSLVTLTDNGFRMNSISTIEDKKLYDNKNRKTGSLTISYKVKYDSTSQGLRFIVYYTDGTSKQILNNNAINVWETNTATTNASKIIDFIGFTYGSGDIPSNFEDVQFEWGSTATSYSPYKELSYPVPAEVQALEGYGWSAGTAYNYIDFERKVFVQRVGRVTVTDGTGFILHNTGTTTTVFRKSNVVNNTPVESNEVSNYLISDAIAYAPSTARVNTFILGGSKALYLQFLTTEVGTTEGLNTRLTNQPLTIYYELSTPIETDISAYLTDDNLIEVEAGGSLTFPNQNGTDYQIPVPSAETYMINLQEAVSNG